MNTLDIPEQRTISMSFNQPAPFRIGVYKSDKPIGLISVSPDDAYQDLMEKIKMKLLLQEKVLATFIFPEN